MRTFGQSWRRRLTNNARIAQACWAGMETERGLRHARRALEIGGRLRQDQLWASAAYSCAMHEFARGRLGEAFDLLD